MAHLVPILVIIVDVFGRGLSGHDLVLVIARVIRGSFPVAAREAQLPLRVLRILLVIFIDILL